MLHAGVRECFASTQCGRTLACALFIVLWAATSVTAQPSSRPDAGGATFDPYRDREDGVATDIFGSYITAGELLIYPFFEYYRDGNFEYKPLELGHGLDVDFRGRYRAHEELIYVGYGINDRVAVELEAATHISATLDKASVDPSTMPGRLHEAGLGDVAARIRWRWNKESAARPEFFTAVEFGLPFQRSRRLTGVQELELLIHTGIIRAFSFGTLSARGGLFSAGGSLEPAEFQFEYIRRLSRSLRVYGGIEGVSDEWSGITELQVFLTRDIVLKLNNAFGLTSKAIGWAPEIGVTFSFGRR